MKIKFFLLVINSVFIGHQVIAAPSSDIPDRRSFPVDSAINPCEDFYKYACSKVINSFKLRDDRSSHTFAFDDSAERLLNKKKDYFKNLAQTKPKTPREESLKNYYLACMNKGERKKAEIAETQRIIKHPSQFKSREEFLKKIGESYLDTESSPVNWGTISNFDRSEINDMYLTADAYLTLPEKSYYKDQKITDDLEKIIAVFFQEIKFKNPKSIAKVIVDFEKSLANVTPSPEEFRQIVNSRNFISQEDLLKKYPQLHFDGFLKSIPKHTTIRNWTPEGLSLINEFLLNASIEDLKNIYIYNSLKGYWDDAYPKFFKANFDFNKKYFGGPDKRTERQERCTRRTMQTFAKEIDFILLPQIFPNFPREKFVNLAEGIRASIIATMQENTWLSKAAKEEALQKMKKAKLQLVSPETESEWDFLPASEYSEKNAIQNEKSVGKVQVEKNLKELREPSDKGKWMLSPLTVNAYYDASYNKFVMPIGILQYPFYDPQLSDIENAGAVGAVIGHELGHAIDDQGSRYDSNGQQRQWMSMDDLKKFSERTQPLIAQFDNIGHNGRLTQGENIGDLVGLTAAYKHVAQQPNFKDNVQAQKDFYLSWARVWCDVSRPKYEENYLKTDPHALSFARVNEQVKLQPGFASAFQCKSGDKMVLQKKQLVHIW